MEEGKSNIPCPEYSPSLEIHVDREPTPTEESEELEKKRKQLENVSREQDIKERKIYADRAHGFIIKWIEFLICLALLQFLFRNIGHGLTGSEFITVITTTTASVFGFWYLVGRYLFPNN